MAQALGPDAAVAALVLLVAGAAVPSAGPVPPPYRSKETPVNDPALGRAASRPGLLRLDEPLPGFTHTAVDVPGGRLHAVVGGQGLDTVVLLAGFPQTWYAWRAVMPLLAEDHRVVALDLPGQGLSTPFVGHSDTETVAEHVHAAVREVVQGRYWLVGHDVGSWVAFTYTLLHAAELNGVALVDAGIPGVTLPDAVPLDPARATKLWHFAFHQVVGLPEALLAGKEHEYVAWFLRTKRAAPEQVGEAEVDLYARALARDGALGAALAHYRDADRSARRNRDLLAQQGRIEVPVLAVDSDHGSIPDMAAPLVPFASRVARATISDAGHFIPEEQPHQLASRLKDFFQQAAQVRAGGASR